MKMLTYPCHGCGACIEYSVFVEAAFCRSLLQRELFKVRKVRRDILRCPK
uniref:Uncharacterized protein n=1 Tax=Anguilla anguilla TaxID=7936 RepID=A0A0E9T8D0_ANGAN